MYYFMSEPKFNIKSYLIYVYPYVKKLNVIRKTKKYKWTKKKYLYDLKKKNDLKII